MFIAAHEWVCAFQPDGFVLKLDDYIAKYPEKFGTIFPSLWNADEMLRRRHLRHPAGRRGAHVLLQQKAHARGRLRRRLHRGDARRRAVGRPDDGRADQHRQEGRGQDRRKYGILHRPNKGPDYIMVFQSYGNNFIDPATGNLLLERDKLAAAFGWFERGVKEGVIPANNTRWNWTTCARSSTRTTTTRSGCTASGIWAAPHSRPTGCRRTRRAFFKDWGWVAVPPAEKGGSPSSLTHPVVYAVSAQHEDPDLAVRLLGFASDPDLNADHAVTTTHLGIKPEELNDQRYADAWPLAKATEMLKFTKFLPNNPQFGDLNGIIYKAMQGVETGRLSARGCGRFRHRRGVVVAQGRHGEIGRPKRVRAGKPPALTRSAARHRRGRRTGRNDGDNRQKS